MTTVRYEIAVMHEIVERATLKSDTDHFVGISREGMDIRKRRPCEESRYKSCKAKICIGFSHEREKALSPGSSRIKKAA
jgi:hypothetical protein